MLIDAHSHIIRKESERDRKVEDTDIELFMAVHDEAGFEKIICVAQCMERIRDSWIPVEPIMELQRKYPDKIIGLTSTEPLDKQGRFNTKGLKFFEKSVKEMGFKGMMWSPGYGHWYPNDKAAYPFYELAVELDVPIYFHLAAWWPEPVDHPMRYGRPYLLDEVIIDFPDLKINIEHMGYPWIDEVLALMSRSKNIYADICGLKGIILVLNLVKAKELGVLDKILYGTDVVSEGTDLKKEVGWFRSDINKKVEKCGWDAFTQQEIEGILGNNAKRLFNL